MVFALFVVALLLVVGLAMLAVSQNSASATLNMEYKQTAFDAAKAGLNQGIDRLDASQGFSSVGSGALANGYTYTYSVKNNLANPNPILNFTDPASGNSVTIPGNRALIVSTGQGPDSQRITAVEAIVKNTQTSVAFPNDAIDAGLDIQGNWNHKIGVAGSAPGVNDATVHANNDITASIGFLGGSASASGTIDSLNAGPGDQRAAKGSTDGPAHAVRRRRDGYREGRRAIRALYPRYRLSASHFRVPERRAGKRLYRLFRRPIAHVGPNVDHIYRPRPPSHQRRLHVYRQLGHHVSRRHEEPLRRQRQR